MVAHFRFVILFIGYKKWQLKMCQQKNGRKKMSTQKMVKKMSTQKMVTKNVNPKKATNKWKLTKGN